MVCPYCGREIVEVTKEHFFPKSIHSNEFDFYACEECNHLKRSHIVYPSSDLLKCYHWNSTKTNFTLFGVYQRMVSIHN